MGEPILVVIFLRGGLDGLNLVGPSADPDYIAARPESLRVLRSGDLAGQAMEGPLADADFRWHHAARPLASLYGAGELAVVHAAGLKHGTRSHFDAEARMERAAGSATAGGWLGRYLSATRPPGDLTALAVGNALPDSLGGYPDTAVAEELADLIAAQGHDLRPLLMQQLGSGAGRHPLLAAPVARLATLGDTLSRHLVDPQTGELRPHAGRETYPGNPLGGSLAAIALAIKLDLGLRVATADYGGWDTHVDQEGDFARLIGGLGAALEAFWRDLDNRREDVLVVMVSEFGRRLRANSGGGTDHGHGNVMMILGAGVRGGRMHGRWPGLANDVLDAGADLAITTDYRHVLADAMASHMGFSDAATLFPGFAADAQGLFN